MAVQELARHAGFQVDKSAVQAIDHFSRDAKDEGKSTRLAVDVSSAHAAVVGPKVKAPVLYSGMVFKAAPRSLTFAVLKAPSTTYPGA